MPLFPIFRSPCFLYSVSRNEIPCQLPHLLQAMGKTEVYDLLCILDFNNVRKRMSVIVKRNGKIRLYCKGADNVIFERLRQGQEEMKQKTQEHLDVGSISFSS